ncbi:hypothetical protein ISS86_02905 [Candidatus Microgenomates bacterium]|nr:hypothetical protein [Candidatus Microgenomates bacterium]
MFNELELQKLKKEYPKFFEQISPELLSFILSEKLCSKISQICLENKIEDEEKVGKIAYQITLALLEQTPKENLAKILEKGVKLDTETAKKIHIEVNHFIFSQIKETKPKKTSSPPSPLQSKGSAKDVYREPIT